MLRFILAAALLLASFPAAAATELQLWHAMEGEPRVALETLAERFNASQADYRVVPAYQGGYPETVAAGMAAHRAGKAPHMLQVYEVGTADMMAERAAYKPIYQLAAETRLPLDKEAWFPPAAAFYSDAQGRLLALPFNSSTPLFYYNKDTFRKAGLDPEKPPATWYDLQPMLVALRVETECPYTTSWQSWVHLENISAWHNYPFASANNGFGAGRAELLFNSHLMIRHVSLLSAWIRSELFRYAGRGNDAERLFATGECAVLTGSSAAYTSIRKAAKFPLGVAALPHYDDFKGAPFNTLIGGAALWAMSGKTAAEYRGVARFMQFIASPEISAEWHKSTGYIPITRGAHTALQKTGFYQEHPEMEIPVNQLRGINSGNYARGVRLPHYEKIRAILDEELEAVWNGSKAPFSALNEAVERGNLLLGAPPPKPAAVPRMGPKSASPRMKPEARPMAKPLAKPLAKPEAKSQAKPEASCPGCK
jgi:sn-glycerol 3-phosphate transport system substrate-binding protein